jgi:hypothetical protein
MNRQLLPRHYEGNFLSYSVFTASLAYFICFIQDCLIYKPSDSTVPKDAVIEPRTDLKFTRKIRSFNHKATSDPNQAISCPPSRNDDFT